MKDYNIVVQVRCESKPEQWIVDCIYEQLNQKINEDILYWQVKEQPPEDIPNEKKEKNVVMFQ